MQITEAIDNKRKSSVVIFLVHGLGMDAGAFKKFAKHSDARVIAPTLCGSSKKDDTDQQITIAEHIDMLKDYIEDKIIGLKFKHPKGLKKIIIVGFSMGADLVSELATNESFNIINRGIEYILLDPNINLKTCFISKKIKDITMENFQEIIVGVMGDIKAQDEQLKSLFNYGNQLVQKFVERPRYLNYMAWQVVDRYSGEDGKNRFDRKVRELEAMVEKMGISVVMYFSQDNEAKKWVRNYKKMGGKIVVVESYGGHFDLISADFLMDEIWFK